MPSVCSKAFRLLPWMVIVATVVGCGSKSDGPVTYPVTGVVTLADQPVADAIVTFQPRSTDAGAAGAQATSGPGGTFEVTLILDGGRAEKKGLPAGAYDVTVTKIETPKSIEMGSQPKNVLPAKYADAKSSGLEATVETEGENRFEFKLTP